jgi:WD40 repeat protein
MERATLATIFISYARKNLALVLSLKEELEELKHDAWLDLEGLPAASPWRDEIARAIEQRDVFLFALTPASASSSETRKELEYAQKLRKRIVPVVLSDVSPEAVDASLREIDWIFLHPEDDAEAGLRRLEDAITVDLDHLHQHTDILLRALGWGRAKRDRSLLLRGGNLQGAELWLERSPGKKPEPILLQRELIAASRQGEKRRRLWQVAVASLLVAISLTLGYVAYRRSQVARTDLSRQLAGNGKDSETLDRALLLAVAAHEISPTGEAVNSLLDSLARAPQLLTMLHGQPGDVNALAFHPHEPILASAGGDGALHLWDTKTWTSLGTLPAGRERIVKLVFAPDGRFLASGDHAGQVRFWDPVRKTEIRPALQAPGGGLVESLAIHPGGQYLAVGYDAGALLWDLGKTPPRPTALQVQDRRVPDIAFDPEGRQLALLEGTESLLVWDFSGSFSNRRQHQPGVGTTEIAWHPDGQSLALGHSDGSVFWVNAGDLSEIRRVSGSGANVLDLAWNEEGTLLAAGYGDGRVRVWNEGGSEPQLALPGQGRVFAVAFQPGTGHLASAGDDPTIHLWDPGLLQPLARLVLHRRSSIQQVALSPDGGWLIAGDLNGRVFRVDLSSGDVEGIPLETGGDIGGVVIAGNHLLWSGDEGVFGLWDLTGKTKPLNWQAEDTTITAVAIRHDGSAFATGGEDGRVSLWRRESGSGQFRETPLKTAPERSGGWIMDLAFSSDGRLLAAGDNEEQILLWDATSLRHLKTWQVPGGTVDLTFSPDDRRLAVVNGGNEQITLLDPRRDEVPEPKAGTCPRVFSVAFRREGHFLITGCDDGSLEHLEVDPWRSLGRLQAYGEFVYSLSPIRDGKIMAAGTSDGRVLIWDLDEESWARRACRRANRDLSENLEGVPSGLCKRLLQNVNPEAPGLRLESDPDPGFLPDNVARGFRVNSSLAEPGG